MDMAKPKTFARRSITLPIEIDDALEAVHKATGTNVSTLLAQGASMMLGIMPRDAVAYKMPDEEYE